MGLCQTSVERRKKKEEFPELKRGARVQQKLPSGEVAEGYWTVTSRKPDKVFLRPDVGPRGYYEHKYTTSVNRRFWDTLVVDPNAPPPP